MSQQAKKQTKQFDDYDSGNGPRPPVPGEESNFSKMTTEGSVSAAAAATTPSTAAVASSPATTNAAAVAAATTTNRSPPPPPYPPSQSPQPSTDSFRIRISRWQQNLEYLLADKEGLDSLYEFVRNDGGEDSKNLKQLDFYFACEGLKVLNDMTRVRKVTRLICEKYLANNIIEAPLDLRRTISQIVERKLEPQPRIFDELQRRVEQIIERDVYPAFLTSEVFIKFAQRYENDGATASDAETVNVADTLPLHVSSSSSSSGICSGVGSMHSMAANTSDGGAATTFNRANADLISPLLNTSNLQTLHEDSELKFNTKSHSMKPRTVRPTPKLTEDLLLATQKGRLEVRPQGAIGYTYSIPFNSSYNPVSRQDSERQSCSSAGQTSDSEVNSKDGRPYMHRRPTPAEDYRKAHLNPSQKTVIKPLNQGLKETVEPISKSRMESMYPIDSKLLYDALENLKRKQELDKGKETKKDQEEFFRNLNTRLHSAAQPRAGATAADVPIQPDLHNDKEHLLRSLSNILNPGQPRNDVDVQSILDHHVSSVFSPRHTPGSTSPKNLHRSHHRSNEMSSSVPDFGMPSMRHSRSIPENASFNLSNSMKQQPSQRRQPHSSALHRYPSQNIDSGISLYSADIPYNKVKEMKPIDQFLDEPMRRSTKDDSRRSRKQLPLPQQQLSSMSQPMLFQQSLSPIPASCSSISSSHHTHSLARQSELMNESQHEYTFAHYHFIDEKIPYRIKIPSKKVTLKLFKEHLPRKGNFRYFFQATCDDPENPVVQEEVVNDSDMVPIYDGKVIASLRLVTD